jgi:hypothetical protein
VSTRYINTNILFKHVRWPTDCNKTITMYWSADQRAKIGDLVPQTRVIPKAYYDFPISFKQMKRKPDTFNHTLKLSSWIASLWFSIDLSGRFWRLAQSCYAPMRMPHFEWSLLINLSLIIHCRTCTLIVIVFKSTLIKKNNFIHLLSNF